ncbi:MAG TPA: OmpH family outer membrane protein [Steroidobacteraceae bacterium]|jgi:outer membrane protein
MSFRRVMVMAGAVALAVAAPAWADLKVGVVNYAKLMQESPQAKGAQDALRAEFAGKQKDLQGQQQALKSKEDNLQRDQGTMSAEQRSAIERDVRDGNRELSLKANQFQDDFNARQNEELSKLQKMLVEEVQNYAQAQKFDLVLADGVIFAAPVLDITPQILSALQARGVRAPAAGASSSGAGTGGASKSSSTPKSTTPPK